MIHEIFPEIFDNHYRNLTPCDGDFILPFYNNAFYFIIDNNSKAGEDYGKSSGAKSDSDGETVSFITWEAIRDNISLNDTILGPVFAFSISHKRYFIVLLKTPLQGFDSIENDWRYFRHRQPKVNAFAAMNAIHLYQWYSTSLFCGKCGHKTEHDSRERMLHCPECGNSIFPRINPAILAVIIDRGPTRDKDRALLTQYRGRGINQYVLVAGFMEFGETAEQCVAREVMEEVGITVKNIRYVDSQPWGYAQNIMMGFVCELDGSDAIAVDQNELKTAAWLTRQECPQREDDDASLTATLIRMFKQGEL